MNPVGRIIRDLCEISPAQNRRDFARIEHEDTVVVSVNDVENIINRNFAELLEFVGKIAECDGTMIEVKQAALKERKLLGFESLKQLSFLLWR